jgi:hypothetical protein
MIGTLSMQQGNDTPSSVRIRENQRRSRNRRKELIEELQGRVQDFERKGVVATQEMQRAARRVAQENLRLRGLLAHHGVPHEEVDAYLRSFDDDNALKDASDAAMLPVPCQAETSSVMASRVMSAADQTQRSNHSIIGSDNDTITPFSRDQADGSSNFTPCTKAMTQLSRPVETLYEMVADDVVEDCPNTSDCFCPPTLTHSIPTDHGLEISCETAANIIVEMRGDRGDLESIRNSLGCIGGDKCTVRNSTVLQIMDES